jgi:hypothetical protein
MASTANRLIGIRRSAAADANARFSDALRHLDEDHAIVWHSARSIALCQRRSQGPVSVRVPRRVGGTLLHARSRLAELDDFFGVNSGPDRLS